MSLRSRFGRRTFVWLAALLAVAIAAVLLWRPLWAWFTLQPLADSQSEAITEHVGPITVKATISPNPPRQQGNALNLSLTDAQGAPVDGAHVSVGYHMPAMGSMAEMRGKASVTAQGKGHYRAAFDLPMAGNWTLNATLRSAAGSGTARFKMTVGSPGLLAAGGETPGAAVGQLPALAPTLPPSAAAALERALDGYARVQELLAADTVAGIADPARALAVSLDQARHEVSNPGEADCLRSAATAAERLTTVRSLSAARTAFAEANRWLLPFIAAEPKLAATWHLFECPPGPGRWAQRAAHPQNPYKGPKGASCGTPVSATELMATQAVEDATAHYSCSMHPNVKRSRPGSCPVCGLTLTPVSKREQEDGIITVPPVRRQEIGVRTGKVVRAPLVVSIRAVGHLTYDETRLTDVSLKVEGWIGKLHVDQTGQHVKRGQPLFTIYSPALYAAEQEYLIALNGQSRSPELVRAAQLRLSLWNFSRAQLQAISKAGRPLEQVPIYSPVSGYVVEKNVVEGAAVKPGQRLFRIAALDRVWVETDLYESDLPLASVGQKAKVTLDYLPGEVYEGRVSYVYPYLDVKARTGKIRIALRNDKEVVLKPGMFATVELEVDRGARLQVPESAVIYTGPRRLVFVDLGQGRLRPQEVQLGHKSGDAYEVLAGLNEGDVVVTSGNFLIAAESRIRSATKYWEPSHAAQ